MNDTNVSVVINPEIYMMRLQALIEENNKLKAQIQENDAEKQEQEPLPQKPRKRRIVTQENNTYSDFKSNGIRKPHAADSIRSYEDFKKIQDYFFENGNIRDWAMWTIGVSLGLRVSDLLSLRFRNVIEDDMKSYRPRIQIYETKTGKLQNCLITESVKNALDVYLRSLNGDFRLEGYLFPSRKTGGKMYEECGWRILSNAGKAVGLPLNIGSHTMRKSFANIAACVDKSSIDMNAITKVQGLLNHSDQKSTMRYLGSYQDMFDRARIAVSDFVLGKTTVDRIIAGNQYTLDDIFERVDALENLLKKDGST